MGFKIDLYTKYPVTNEDVPYTKMIIAEVDAEVELSHDSFKYYKIGDFPNYVVPANPFLFVPWDSPTANRMRYIQNALELGWRNQSTYINDNNTIWNDESVPLIDYRFYPSYKAKVLYTKHGTEFWFVQTGGGYCEIYSHGARSSNVGVMKSNALSVCFIKYKGNFGELSVQKVTTYSGIQGGFRFYSAGYMGGSTDQCFKNMLSEGDIVDYQEDTDPFAPGGNTPSEPTGGGGKYTRPSTPIPVPSLPALGAQDATFVTIFLPGKGGLKALANYMWSTLFDIEGWLKIFANPMDCILSVSIVPLNVPKGGVSNVRVGNVPTPIQLDVAANQFLEVDCGYIQVDEYFKAYLDYSPYTKVDLYLPFISTVPLDVDEIMGKKVGIKYHVDILTGACVAFVTANDSVLYTYAGTCAAQIPITANDAASAFNGALSVGTSIGGALISGGLSAPIAAGAAAVASTIMSAKPYVQKGGSLSGSAGLMSIRKPYLIFSTPNQALPSYQNKFLGYPSFMTEKLSSLSGYTIVEEIHVTGTPALGVELEEIESLLKEGVIL